MKENTNDAVKAVQTAAGWTSVRPGTFEELGAGIAGSPVPVYHFTDDETGREITIPRSAVTAIDGDLAEPPPPPPPPPPDPYDWPVRGGVMKFRSAATLEPDQRAHYMAELGQAFADVDNDRRQALTKEVVQRLWIAPENPYVKAQQDRQNTTSQNYTRPTFPEYDEFATHANLVAGTYEMGQHMLTLLQMGEAEYQATLAEKASA